MTMLSAMILVLFRFASDLVPYADASSAIVQFLQLLYPSLPEDKEKRMIALFLALFLIFVFTQHLPTYTNPIGCSEAKQAQPAPLALPPPTTVPEWLERYIPIIPIQGLKSNTIYDDSIRWLKYCLRSIYGCDIYVDGTWDAMTTQYLQYFKDTYGFDSEPADTLTRNMAYYLLEIYLELGFDPEKLVQYCHR